MCLAVPGKIVQILSEEPLSRCGKVDFGGVVREINLSCTEDAGIGDYVLVHAGMAIGKIEEKEALETLAMLKEISDLSKADNPS